MARTSNKREQILNFLTQFMNEHGYAPTVREICNAVGLQSTATVHYHLNALRDAGLIEMDEMKKRAISLPDAQRADRIPVVGVVTAVLASLLFSLLFAYFVLKLKSDLILTGIALNLMASGGTVFLLAVLCGDKGVSTSMDSLVVPSVELPLIRSIPVLGKILSGHNLLTYVALLSVVLVYLLINKSPLGLRIRSVGENPDAAESVGISVIKTRFIALTFTGILARLGGAYMSMGYVSWFARDMAAGRGYMALSAQNLGNGTPIGTFLASFIFGIADALSSTLQVLSLPAEFIQMIPYVTTIIGLILYAISRKRRAAKARAKL